MLIIARQVFYVVVSGTNAQRARSVKNEDSGNRNVLDGIFIAYLTRISVFRGDVEGGPR